MTMNLLFPHLNQFLGEGFYMHGPTAKNHKLLY